MPLCDNAITHQLSTLSYNLSRKAVPLVVVELENCPDSSKMDKNIQKDCNKTEKCPIAA